ncbi:MAG: hypothetical protein WBE14_16770 [Xanthobacteraceae bacterium]|jgi:hypothetical protein
MDQQFNGLMVALRSIVRLDDHKSVEAAKLQIWRCIQPLVEADKKPFLERLRTEAIAEENKAPSDLAKLFWRDVAEYALSPTKPKN